MLYCALQCTTGLIPCPHWSAVVLAWWVFQSYTTTQLSHCSFCVDHFKHLVKNTAYFFCFSLVSTNDGRLISASVNSYLF